MIEKIILDYLSETLEVPCYMEEQEESDESYIIIEKTSGGETNHIRIATIAIQSYAPTLYEAALLNELVIEAMAGIIELGSVSRSRLNSDYNYTDTTKKKYRYQAIFDLTYY